MSSEIKTINIRGKSYVEVAERVRLVHDQKRAFEVVESEPFTIGDRTLWKVTILVDEKKYKGNAEVKLNAPKNTPDGSNPYECAETSALGRALAFAGFGSVESIASFDEVARAITSQSNQNEPKPIQNVPVNTSRSQQNGARVTAMAQQENKPAPVSNIPSKVSQQPSAVLNMLKRAKARAEQLNLDWESEKANVLGKAIPDNQLTVQHLASINGDLTKAEQQQKAS
jgi:hypothetical protein